MARKVTTFTIDDVDSRDNGKVFQITEMPVTKIDAWANTLLASAAKGGVDVRSMDFEKIAEVFNFEEKGTKAIAAGKPIDVVGGILELANLSIASLGNITASVFQNSLDDLIENCVTVVSSGGAIRPMLDVDDEIEELKTLWLLRKECFGLHVNFLTKGNS